MLTDIEIAQKATLKPITEIAKQLNISEDDLECYGKYKAKISFDYIEKLKTKQDGKLILVTAINPTPAGEGKTTTTVGIGQAFQQMGKNAIIAIREPSLGPVFGIKGGAAGGGYAQVVPMEDINLHFTGDFHAIGAANNLLCAAVDNHLHQGNALGIHPKKILIKRVVDMNDRALRNTVIGLGSEVDGVPREDGFSITVASEIMAIFCLAENLSDLKNKLSEIVIGYNYQNKPVKVKDLKVEGAMTALLKDAIKPNLVQTLENSPCLIHGGPFANIAHGCNSVIATKLALKMADYTITEAGFGADLGAEKFLNIKCRSADLKPDCVVIVATVRALKYNGGVKKEDLKEENVTALEKGIVNLERHISNMKKFGLKTIVAINSFDTDTDNEFAIIEKCCDKYDTKCVRSEVFVKGGEGGIELAKAIMETCEGKSDFHPIYDLDMSLEDKISTIAKEIYGAKDIIITKQAEKAITLLKENGYGNLPVCIAKNQYSFSDDPTQLGAPSDFNLTISEVRLAAGAGFIVVLTGKIMTMPGLPKAPAYEKIDVDENGNITGLF